MKRIIKKVAILGSGVMGSRIACHFANIGVKVLLLDIAPKELLPQESKTGLDLNHPKVKNRLVNTALQTTIKTNPSPIYSKKNLTLIETGNFDDDMPKIAQCDWIMEAVVENLKIKKIVFDQVEQYRKPGTIISTNTSGIPINLMLDGRSEDFKQHFCGTHFFNPPRYLKLLEIIPTHHTLNEVVEFLMDYGTRFLGKKTVICKDTPAFIANRVGVYSIMSLFHYMEKSDLTIEEVDKLTGTILGRAKSATFRTADVVGLDTLVKVATGLKENCPNDEANAQFNLPQYVQHLVNNNWLGSKSGQGFYKKTTNQKGESEILTLNLKTLEYQQQKKVKFQSFEVAKAIENLKDRTKVLFNAEDAAGDFYRANFLPLFQYVTNRIPEIADDIYQIDDALKAGFGWSLGPFETWDAIGFNEILALLESKNLKPANWVYEMKSKGFSTFYGSSENKKTCYNSQSQKMEVIPTVGDSISLEVLRPTNTIWKNTGTTITDLGDGVINLEIHTKMNTIGSDVLQGINKAIDLAEQEYKALTIYNEGDNFSAGANVGMIFMMAVDQDFDELELAIRYFQNTMMRVRYSAIPVVVAPHNLTLGGGCEMCLHADKVIAHAETYMGLVEFGVGVIPGGGGTKEFALRFSDELHDGDVKINQLRNRFLTIGQAKVSTSAEEAFELGYLRKGIDEWIVNREQQLAYAKEVALDMANKGYVMPTKRTDIEVLGNEGLGIVYVGANSMTAGNYISEYDQFISEKLGYVLCGGDLSRPTKVSEDYLLKLERQTFLELCSKRKTLERLQSIIKTGKVLRN